MQTNAAIVFIQFWHDT